MKRLERSGQTLMELVIVLLLALVLGVGLLSVFFGYGRSYDNILGENVASVAGRTPVDLIADHLRNAQQYESANFAAIQAGTINSVTYYGTTGGSTVRYWRDGADLKRTDSSGTRVVMSGLTQLTFTYYKSNIYNTDSWVTTDNPNAPTSTELRRIGAIRISAAATIDGYQRSYNTLVRLRNSPRKTVL